MYRPVVIFLSACWMAMAAAQTLPGNLWVQVKVEGDEAESASSAQVVIGTRGVGGSMRDVRRGSASSRVQQLMVMDGASAAIQVGETRPLRLRQVVYGPGGGVVAEGWVLRSFGSGFQVAPRLAGDRVVVEIFTAEERPVGNPLGGQVVRLSTSISGRLGEWLPLGGSDTVEAGDYGGQHSEERRIWLKVEQAP